MKNRGKNKKLTVFITILTIMVLCGITYTFFSASVSNSNNEKFSTQTATLSLEFADNDNGVNGTLNLGESIVKKFTIKNKGTVEAYGKINWYDLVNTYTPDSLSWTLEQSEAENGTYSSIAEGYVPTSQTSTTKILKDSLFIPINTTYYYKLTITLNNLDVEQNSDINAIMHSKFSLSEGKATLPATTVIQNLARGADPASTDPIDITVYETKQKWVQQEEYEGEIYEADFFDTKEDCEENIEYHGYTNYQCIKKEKTYLKPFNIGNKWIVKENSSKETYNIFDTESECSTFLTDQNLTSNYSCEEKEVSIENHNYDFYSNNGNNYLAYDKTIDNNLRYVGEKPDNYVILEDEMYYDEFYYDGQNFTNLSVSNSEEDDWWSNDTKEQCLEEISYSLNQLLCVPIPDKYHLFRIVGLMNNVLDSNNNSNSMLKIISDDYIRQEFGQVGYYSFSDYSIDNNTNIAVRNNDWSKSILMTELNTDFLNSNLNPTIFWQGSTSLNKTYDHKQSLTNNMKSLIADVKWNLGGLDTAEVTAYDAYAAERQTKVWGSEVGQTCNDGACPRATNWTGKIALPYPSDTGFAVGGENRSSCLQSYLNGNNYSTDCQYNTWLTSGWYLTPASSYSTGAYIWTYSNRLSEQLVGSEYIIFPTFYLKPEVKITGGDGTYYNPYRLGI